VTAQGGRRAAAGLAPWRAARPGAVAPVWSLGACRGVESRPGIAQWATSLGRHRSPHLRRRLLAASADAAEEAHTGDASRAELFRDVRGVRFSRGGPVRVNSFYTYRGSLTGTGSPTNAAGHSRATARRLQRSGTLTRGQAQHTYTDTSRSHEDSFKLVMSAAEAHCVIRPGYGRKGSCPGCSNAWSTKMVPPSNMP
jgi:hypothetical protein